MNARSFVLKKFIKEKTVWKLFQFLKNVHVFVNICGNHAFARGYDFAHFINY